MQLRPRVTAASGDEVDRPSDSQAMKPYIEIAVKTKADAMKLFEQAMEKLLQPANLPHSTVFLHHFIEFDADKCKMRQKNVIFAMNNKAICTSLTS